MRLESCIPALGFLAATVTSPVHCAQAPKFDVDGTLALRSGVARGVDYDYSEWLFAWTFKDRIRADLGYSNDVFASDEPGWAWQLEFTQALSASSSLSVAYGAYQLERVYGTSYGYGEIALRRDIGPWTLGLTYSTTSASARTLFAAEAVGARLVASVELSVW